VSGNPKGRPTKLSKVDFGDLERFRNTLVEIDTPYGRRSMTRRAAIQERLYVSAMKGNVHAQIHLDRKFEKSMQDRAEISAELNRLVLDIVTKGRQPTEEEADWIQKVRVLFRELPRPGEKVKEPRSRAKKRKLDGGPESAGVRSTSGDVTQEEADRLRDLRARMREISKQGRS
jgi:hypothetical protein